MNTHSDLNLSGTRTVILPADWGRDTIKVDEFLRFLEKIQEVSYLKYVIFRNCEELGPNDILADKEMITLRKNGVH